MAVSVQTLDHEKAAAAGFAGERRLPATTAKTGSTGGAAASTREGGRRSGFAGTLLLAVVMFTFPCSRAFWPG